MRILILGANGMLGTALQVRLAGSPHEAIAWGREQLDVTALGTSGRFSVLRNLKPDAVVNCAAWTDVDAAETHELEAMDVNAQAPGAIAMVCREMGSHLVHVSTDYVFDGAKQGPYVEIDPVCPVNAYGRTKLEGEMAVAKRLKGATIARTAWLYGAKGRNFVDTILAKARQGGPLRVVMDQKGCPTWTHDLADGLIELAVRKAPGIYHVTNGGFCTWFELARAIVEEGQKLGLLENPVEVQSVTSKEFPRPAKRPSNSMLDNAKYGALTGKPLRPWREALIEYLKTLAEAKQPAAANG